MATQFTYSISNDTLNGAVASNKIQQEIRISDITIALEGVTISGDNLIISFKANVPTNEEVFLTTVVNSHDGNPGLDDPQKTQLVDENGNPLGTQSSPRVLVDVVGTLGDGKVSISDNDDSTDFLENKIVSENNKTQVSVINEDGTEQLQISIVPSNINTSELNNDASFINSSQAPVQPSDIANFEPTTNLNARDIANRNRSNHTGTQLSNTISDFPTAVQSNETVTTLSFNNTTKILSYTNESGSQTDVDLTQFIDDTNLSRITTGTLDSQTGIATFTRDDNSTFTVDFSSLNDQAAINTAISTHEQTIANHNDIDLAGLQTGDVLAYNGSQFTPKKSFKDFIVSKTPRGTQSTSFQNYITKTVNIPEDGFYKISWFYVWSINSTQNDFICRLQVDNTQDIFIQQKETKDSGGTGISISAIEGGTFNTGTNQRITEGGHDIITMTSGSHILDLDLRNEVSNTEAAIYQAIISIERWN